MVEPQYDCDDMDAARLEERLRKNTKVAELEKLRQACAAIERASVRLALACLAVFGMMLAAIAILASLVVKLW